MISGFVVMYGTGVGKWRRKWDDCARIVKAGNAKMDMVEYGVGERCHGSYQLKIS